MGPLWLITREKNVRVTMEFKVPKRIISRPTSSTVMFQRDCGGRHKRGALVEEEKHGPMTKNVVIIKSKWIFLREE